MISERISLGWREWVSLPDLNIPSIKCKVDTGARTSALHAFSVEEFDKSGIPWVRFLMHPFQNNETDVVVCEAPISDQRIVSDSGGHKENRIVIKSKILIGSLEKEIEITLTNRDTMKFRMLLGRTAMHGDIVVVPDKSYLTGDRYKPEP
jgi:hypothetical protein